jgi:hypothetical protein
MKSKRHRQQEETQKKNNVWSVKIPTSAFFFFACQGEKYFGSCPHPPPYFFIRTTPLDMDLRYLHMTSYIRHLHYQCQLVMGFEGVDPEICQFLQISEWKYKFIADIWQCLYHTYVHMTDMDLRYIDMTSDIFINEVDIRIRMELHFICWYLGNLSVTSFVTGDIWYQMLYEDSSGPYYMSYLCYRHDYISTINLYFIFYICWNCQISWPIPSKTISSRRYYMWYLMLYQNTLCRYL